MVTKEQAAAPVNLGFLIYLVFAKWLFVQAEYLIHLLEKSWAMLVALRPFDP